MEIEKGFIYHIYNQGNNRGKVFFERKNYLFFLEKVRKYMLPYCDILAWCLMPNHFHFMVLVNEVNLPVIEGRVSRDERLGVSPRHTESGKAAKLRTLNTSIGIMIMGYAKAINNQENRTGKLFREETKAECINCPNGITPTFYATEFGTQIHVSNPEKEYPQACFNYIHQNPVKAGLVTRPEEWEYSSAKDYAGLRNGKLINKRIARKYIDF